MHDSLTIVPESVKSVTDMRPLLSQLVNEEAASRYPVLS